MTLLIALLSIYAIAGFMWLADRVSGFRVCPVCAGISGTWLWMLAAKFLGYRADTVVIALLMGGSVVGIAYALQKRPGSSYSFLSWKMLFIPAGFAAAYWLAESEFVFAVPVVLVLIVLVFGSTVRLGQQDPARKRVIGELEEKMKDCC